MEPQQLRLTLDHYLGSSPDQTREIPEISRSPEMDKRCQAFTSANHRALLLNFQRRLIFEGISSISLKTS